MIPADDPELTPVTDEDLDDMEARFPPTEMSFADALEQIRAGREVKRKDKPYWIGCSDNQPLTARDIAADDWVICG